MAAEKGEKAAEKGETAAKKEEMGVKVEDEEKGATPADEEKRGATAEVKGKKRQTAAAAAAAAGKMVDLGSSEGKLSVEVEWNLSEEAEWKWKIGTPADEGEGAKPRRERRRWRSTRREPAAAVAKEQDATAAAEEDAGEKAIFFFSATAAGKRTNLECSEAAKLSEEAVWKLSEEAEWKWKISTTAGEEEEVPKPRRERRRFRGTRREPPPPAADKEIEPAAAAAAAAKEVAGEKGIFFFSATAAGKTINLVSSEGKLFKMSEAAARLSAVLADMIDDGCAGGYIPLPNVDARALATVIKYCDKHTAAAKPCSHSDHGVADGGGGSSSSSTGVSTTEASEKTLAEWDRKLVGDLAQDALYDLIVAANFLDIKGLLEATCQKVADMIKGKTPAQIRSTFHIAADFTEEEEAEIRKETPWLYED